jgi:hypothetical protein
MYAWIIDEDKTAGPGDEPGTNMNAAGVCGPRQAPEWATYLLESRPELVGKIGGERSATVERFRMFDDDGELYYVGRLLWQPEDDDEDAELAPLYDYGSPNAGCTEIKIKRGDKWVSI